MKYFSLLFSLLFAAALVSCGDDDDANGGPNGNGGGGTGGGTEETETPTKSDLFLEATLGGQAYSFTGEDGNFLFMNSAFGGDGACQLDYGAWFRDNFGSGLESFRVHIVHYTDSDGCDDSGYFQSVFSPGPQEVYSYNVTNSSGAFILYDTPQGITYSTAFADNSDLNLVIEEIVELPNDFDPAAFGTQFIGLKGTFSGMLYTSTFSDSLQVSDGSFFMALNSSE